jgi:hypothetical protein
MLNGGEVGAEELTEGGGGVAGVGVAIVVIVGFTAGVGVVTVVVIGVTAGAGVVTVGVVVTGVRVLAEKVVAANLKAFSFSIALNLASSSLTSGGSSEEVVAANLKA